MENPERAKRPRLNEAGEWRYATVHRMDRRCQGWDYTVRCIYEITIELENRASRSLGQLLVRAARPSSPSGASPWQPVEALRGESAAALQPDDAEARVARSPLGDLARAKGVPIHICEGVHDGHNGSVPIGHSIRAFNQLAAEKDRLDDAFIAFAEKNETVPAELAFKGRDPFFAAKNRIHFRRTSGNVCLTLFEGGHAGNYASAADFLARQTKGRPADWTLPETGTGGENVSTK